MSSPFNTPPTGKYQPPEPMSCEPDEKSLLFVTTEEHLSIPSSPLSRNESLMTSVQSLSVIVEKKLLFYEEKFQQYEIANAELQKRFNEKEIEMKKMTMEYEAKIDDLKKELTQVVDETKKKKWCHRCWNEITFNRVGIPACSDECFGELFASPVHSISSDSSDSSVQCVTEETTAMAVNGPSENVSKSALYQNGHAVLVNGSNDKLSKVALTNDGDPFMPPDIASLIRTLEE